MRILKFFISGLCILLYSHPSWATGRTVTIPINVAQSHAATGGGAPTSSSTGTLTVSLINISSVEQPVTVTLSNESIASNYYCSSTHGSCPGLAGYPTATSSQELSPSIQDRSQTFTLTAAGTANATHIFTFSRTCVYNGSTVTYHTDTGLPDSTLCQSTTVSQLYSFYKFNVSIQVNVDSGAVLASVTGVNHVHCSTTSTDDTINIMMNGGRPF